ncbi:AAA family ATPase [Mycoplasmatota bacterium WC44]
MKNCLEVEIDNLGNIEEGKGTLFFRKKDYVNPFEFNVLSSGEKEVVDILLDLYLRQDTYSDSIFIIDEPELHLNTSIQRKLLTEINKLVGENCQIWIATHSIGFLRSLQDELKNDCQIIEFKKENNWANQSYTLTPLKNNRANWKSIFSTALDDLTNLVSPKCIVYCEGKDKPGRHGVEKGFDANVYNTIFESKYPDTFFVSSGGNTELDQRSDIALAILTKVFTSINIWVLKDRDISSGKSNDENDRQVYLNNNSLNHRVLKRWELENYLYDKEVLKKYCKSNKLIFDEIEYDKHVHNINNQNIKDATGRIKNFCNITTSINSEVFKLNLARLITDDMNIYKELEEVVFERK